MTGRLSRSVWDQERSENDRDHHGYVFAGLSPWHRIAKETDCRYGNRPELQCCRGDGRTDKPKEMNYHHDNRGGRRLSPTSIEAGVAMAADRLSMRELSPWLLKEGLQEVRKEGGGETERGTEREEERERGRKKEGDGERKREREGEGKRGREGEREGEGERKRDRGRTGGRERVRWRMDG